VPEADIHKVAKGKGGLLGKLFVRAPLTELRVEYKKYYRCVFTYAVNAKLFLFKRKEIQGKIEIIVDAFSGKCGVNNSYPFSLEKVEGRLFLDGKYDMSENEAHAAAFEFARRVVLRLARSAAEFGEYSKPECFYRPHWMAYYGDPKEKDCRYLPFEADGHTIKR